MVVGLDEPGHEGGAGQVEAPDVGDGQVGPGGQVGLRLGGGAHEQDALAAQENRAPATGAPGVLGRARALAVGPDGGDVAYDLKGAGCVAAASRNEPVGGHQDGGTAVETLSAVGGRSDPPGDLTGCREGIVGHDVRIAGFHIFGVVCSVSSETSETGAHEGAPQPLRRRALPLRRRRRAGRAPPGALSPRAP